MGPDVSLIRLAQRIIHCIIYAHHRLPIETSEISGPNATIYCSCYC